VRGLAHGFLVPVFFVVLGARLDVAGLDVRTFAVVLVAGVAIRIAVGAILRLPLGVGLLAAATLGVPAAVVEVGLDEGLLDAGQAAGIIAAALGSIAFAALGTDRLHRQAARQEPAGQP
jgi:Kef-type K+ transport system membrane component KefB